jgi:hypothetical protein
MGPGLGWAGLPGPTGLGPSRPSSLPPLRGVGSRVFWILPPFACRPLLPVSLRVGRSFFSSKIRHFLGRSSEFVMFSGSVPGLLGVKFASLHDLYGASRSCHKVLDELISKVLLSTSKPCINTKLQNRHARMNLLYQGG